MLFKFKKRNINMAKNKNTAPSPFHKKGKNEGDQKRSGLFGDWKDDAYGEDEWDIKSTTAKMDTSFSDFQGLKDIAGQNLWSGARNMMNIKNNFGGVQTDFDNQYADVTNTFEGMKNRYAGMENTMEDLTVNQQQAQFQKEMAAQQQADTLSQLGGAAGGSGIAGLAQAMAGAQSQQRQAASASIGQQESANQMAAAQAGMSIQQMEASGASAVDMAKAQGGMQTQLAQAQGAQAAMQLGSQAELAQAQGLQQGQIARGQGAMDAQKIRLQGAADSRDLQIGMQQAELSYLAGLKEAAEANKDADTAGKSDRRLKKNINKIGQSASGLNIYSFEYKNPLDGEGLFQGVMSDEVPQEAVINNGEYDMVNYGMLDVEFKQI